eukprot:CAMPEP_0174349256 /NCGR_PEP_ID=MMETSP0811_2-20130205/5964_1 /TAXON_ID=73025 ORGANISM="Eutreptiella gymnastica-like, Strain CCMP1594" /NCGR_SAMPLE_ID=MMETSP0811_2 /ASSEMBLY_ACC=CAM_ASM_000667 /LENGTH=97 /DNA_ID=CAMNT_0015476521 /DNA_START=330 /DNA_END=619 /DNA_ORIENTATION=-
MSRGARQVGMAQWSARAPPLPPVPRLLRAHVLFHVLRASCPGDDDHRCAYGHRPLRALEGNDLWPTSTLRARMCVPRSLIQRLSRSLPSLPSHRRKA